MRTRWYGKVVTGLTASQAVSENESKAIMIAATRCLGVAFGSGTQINARRAGKDEGFDCEGRASGYLHELRQRERKWRGKELGRRLDGYL